MNWGMLDLMSCNFQLHRKNCPGRGVKSRASLPGLNLAHPVPPVGTESSRVPFQELHAGLHPHRPFMLLLWETASKPSCYGSAQCSCRTSPPPGWHCWLPCERSRSHVVTHRRLLPPGSCRPEGAVHKEGHTCPPAHLPRRRPAWARPETALTRPWKGARSPDVFRSTK